MTTRLREQPELFAATVEWAILSALLAIAALIPIPGKVDVDNLRSIRKRFGRLSAIRGTLVAFATIFLLAALGSASRGALAYVAQSGPSQPAIAISRSNVVGEPGPTIAATVTQVRAPAGARADLSIRAGSGAIVYRAVQIVGSSGEVSLTAAIAKSAGGSLTLLYTLTTDRELTRKEVPLGE